MRAVSTSLSAILLSLFAFTGPASADDKTAAICAEAEERYVEQYGAPSSAADGVAVVLMYKYKFCPEQIEVPIGTTVRWVNVDKRTSHSIILKDTDEPETDRLFPEESFEFTFIAPGAQNYLCGPHWESHDMIGMVTVKP